MIRQKPISLKIYEDLLNSLDSEGQIKNKRRNTLINMAVHNFVDQEEIRRRFFNADEKGKKQLFCIFMREYFPEAYYQYKDL